MLLIAISIIIAVANEYMGGKEFITTLSISLATACGPVVIVTIFLEIGFGDILKDAATHSFKLSFDKMSEHSEEKIAELFEKYIKAIEDTNKHSEEKINKIIDKYEKNNDKNVQDIDNVKNSLANQINECKKHTVDLLNSTVTLSVLKECGIVEAFKNRGGAYDRIKSFLRDGNNREFIFVGTSFRGLYWPIEGDPQILELIEMLSAPGNSASLKFIFTHPAFAYLRSYAEGKERTDSSFSIRQEILQSVLMLRKIGVKEQNIKFYKGTPTLFGVMTDNHIFLNPYPYKKQSYTSFGITIAKSEHEAIQKSLYSTFKEAHFTDVWDDRDNTVEWRDDKLEQLWESTIKDVVKPEDHHSIPPDLVKDRDSLPV